MPKEQRISFHGKLIKSTIEYWALRSVFEQNDVVLRNKLTALMEEYISIIDAEVKWNNSPDLIDMNMIAGNIYYDDENGLSKNMAFQVSIKGKKTIIQTKKMN